MAGPNEAIAQARQFWETRNSRQKLLLVAGACATAVLVALFVRLIGTPDFKPMSTGLEPADAQALAAQLDAAGIPHQTSADGKTISVPSEKLAEARMKTASEGAGHSGRMGFELFDKMSWGQTEFDQKVTYQRALEGELEKTIETLSDVESARVHLVMAKDSVFLDKEQPAKASVILKLHGKGLPKESALAISRLVSGAVNNLSPEDVSIIDADSARSLGVSHDGEDNASGVEESLTQRLIATLGPVVGADKIRASVTVDQTQESTEESQEKYDPGVSALLSDQKSEETANGGAVPSGVAGTSSNTPSPVPAKTTETAKAQSSAQSAAQSPSQSSKTESAQYGVNKVVLHTVLPAGRIQRISAAILVDDMVATSVQGGKTVYTRKKWSQDQLDKIQGLAQAVIGFDAKRGDTVTVQNMSFDSDPVASELPPPNWMDKGRKVAADYSSLLRPVSLLFLFMLAYLFIVRPVQKQVLSQQLLPASATAHALGGGQGMDRLGAGYADRDDSPQAATKLKDQMVEVIKQKPVNSTRAVQSWLREEQS